MARLGVNIDHIATLRQARQTQYPDPIFAAYLAEMSGADNITCHLREDRRHIQDRDLHLLRDIIQTQLNFEMAATEEMIQIALKIKPETVTLVPEKRQELTTEGGLNLLNSKDFLNKCIQRIKDQGIEVSLFIDPCPDAIQLAKKMDADSVEIHTGAYALATDQNVARIELNRIKEAVMCAKDEHLHIHAGHGLNYENIQRVAVIKEIESFQIGHSIVSRAVMVGLEKAIRQMKELIA